MKKIDVTDALQEFLASPKEGECPLWFPFGMEQEGYVAKVLRNCLAGAWNMTASVSERGLRISAQRKSGQGNYLLYGLPAKPKKDPLMPARVEKLYKALERWLKENHPGTTPAPAADSVPRWGGYMQKKKQQTAERKARRQGDMETIRQLSRQTVQAETDVIEITPGIEEEAARGW